MSMVVELIKTMMDPAEEITDLEHTHRHVQMDILYQGRPDINKHSLAKYV